MYFPVFEPYDNNNDFKTDNSNNELCLICWENESTEIIIPFKKLHQYPTHCECNGLFHLICIEKWMEINNSCPICREKVLELTSCENSVITIINACYFYVNILRKILLFFQICSLVIFINFVVIFCSNYRN